MSIILLQLPDVDRAPNGRPRHCPYCGGSILQRWGQVTKSVRDPEHRITEVHRYRCCQCTRTFRDYPEGIDRSNRTRRIRHLAALAWAMGLSCRDVVSVFRDLGVRLSRMTVWRDGQELVARLSGGEGSDFSPAFSLDRVYPGDPLRRFGVKVAIDLGFDKIVVLGTLDEHNPRLVNAWLEPIAREMDLQVVQMTTATLRPFVAPSNGEVATRV